MNQQRMRTPRSAFTLVELLVTVAIIAVLMAVLLPALGKARFQSNIVRCLANQRGLGAAVIAYGNDFKNYYPYRTVSSVAGGPSYLLTDSLAINSADDRPMFKSFLTNIDRQLTCPLDPLAPGMSLSRTTLQTWIGYELWFGTQIDSTRPGSKMFRVGDRPRYNISGTVYTFNVLATDVERDCDGQGGLYNINAAHPDDIGTLARTEIYDATYTYQAQNRAFGSAASMTRSLMQKNYLFDDGSGKTRRIKWRDPVLVKLPAETLTSRGPSYFVYLPPMD